jgi:hypothetical protein
MLSSSVCYWYIKYEKLYVLFYEKGQFVIYNAEEYMTYILQDDDIGLLSTYSLEISSGRGRTFGIRNGFYKLRLSCFCFNVLKMLNLI